MTVAPFPTEPVQALLSRLQHVKRDATGWMARCPAHDDARSSLHVGVGAEGKVLVTCHAGCTLETITAAVGMTVRELFPERVVEAAAGSVSSPPTPPSSSPVAPTIAPPSRRTRPAPLGRVVAEYLYRDESGAKLFKKVRHEPKDFRIYRFESTDLSVGWRPGLGGSRAVLYRLPELLAANPAAPVFVTEGEKDADNVAALGPHATTNPGGAGRGKWLESFTETLRGRHVVILPDNDPSGQAHAENVANAVHGVAASVRILNLPGLPKKGDVSDWIAIGGTGARLLELAKAAPEFVPAGGGSASKDNAPDNDGGEDIPTWESSGTTSTRTPRDPDPLRAHDTGNGERFARQHGRDVFYCFEWHKWVAWDGRRWAVDSAGEVMRRAKRTAYSIYDEAAAAGKAGKGAHAEALWAWAKRSLEAGKLNAMLKTAQSEPGIGVSPELFDRDPWSLNVENGTIDLRTGALRPHARADLLTKIAPVPYDPDATCPTFEAFLLTIMKQRRDLVDFLQRYLGYCLTGSTKEQVFVFFYGEGANGKSTLLDLMLAVLGEYAIQAVSDLLMTQAGGGERHPTELADLFGRRLALSIETEAGRMLAESRTKQLTGGDKIRARRMREDFWEFTPTHKLILAANHKPVVRGTDIAIWRRILMVPFDVTAVDPNEQKPNPPTTVEKDPHLPEKLARELPGVLAWLVRGCQEWRKSGLRPPRDVRAAVEDYHEEMDAIGQFLEESCVVGETLSIESGTLYATYRAWSENRGDRKPMHANAFGRELTKRGIEAAKGTGGVRLRNGVSLKGVSVAHSGVLAVDQGFVENSLYAYKSKPEGMRLAPLSATPEEIEEVDL